MQDRIFLRKIEDRYAHFLRSQVITATDFLSLEEQSDAMRFVAESHKALGEEGAVFFFGGYRDAERRQIIFMPSWTGVSNEDEACEYFRENPELSPQSVITAALSKHDHGKLGHRDYLGAIMALGIKREVLGDILVSPGGAQIVCREEIAEYLSREFSQSGHVSLSCSAGPVSCIRTEEIKTEIVRLNVASPRLDNVVAAVFNLSRKDAVTAINRGLVFTDGAENTKPDYQLKENQKLVLRGKGKAFYLGQTGTSKKGKAYIEIKKYL